MKTNNLSWIRYLSPFVGIIFSPVTILFLWAFWTGPIIEAEQDYQINRVKSD